MPSIRSLRFSSRAAASDEAARNATQRRAQLEPVRRPSASLAVTTITSMSLCAYRIATS